MHFLRFSSAYTLAVCLLLSLTTTAQERYNLELLSNVPFPGAVSGEEGNDIWGYVDDQGTEYAIIGSTIATYIYSLEDPTNPVLRSRIPGNTSTWRDIKFFGDYVYITTDDFIDNVEDPDGLTVVDMSGAPENISFSRYNPTVTIDGQSTRLEKAHNLYITENGLLVLAGANIYSGTPLFFDLTVNPTEPPFVGNSVRTYAHDVFAERGLLYSSDILTGNLTLHDYTDLSNIFVLGSGATSTNFTHNAWPTDDDSFVFTTDEKERAFVDAFDVRDTSDPRFLDKFRPDDSYTSRSIPHNTHVLGDYLATSWYEDGIVLTDASRPHNLVEVGRYDTFDGEPPAGTRRFVGNWGAYPYLPSGLLIISDINSGLYVFDPTYEKGCYFEGVVLDSISRQPLSGVTVNFSNLEAQQVETELDGEFAIGIHEEGNYLASFSRPGYASKQLVVNMSRGELNEQAIELVPLFDANITVTVVDESGAVIPDAQSILTFRESARGAKPSAPTSTPIQPGVMAQVTAGRYDVVAGKWGYLTNSLRNVDVDPTVNNEITIVLQAGIYDDFIFDFEWDVQTNAIRGGWERGAPIGVLSGGQPAQLGADLAFDFGTQAFVTGNVGGDASVGDVDNGTTILTSPVFDLSGQDNALVEFYYFFYNEGGRTTPNDELLVSISNGTETVELLTETSTLTEWTKFTSPALGTLLTLSDQMTVSFSTSDLASSGHLVEAMLDGFSVTAFSRPELVISPAFGCAPATVSVALAGSVSGSISWEFVGAVQSSFSGPTASVVYTEAGSYDIVLEVVDDQGRAATFTYPEAISVDPATDASFRTVIFGDTVFCINQSLGGGSALWDFGDGSTSTEQSTTHIYTSPGTYSVSLTMDGLCNEATETQTLTIGGSSSTTDLTADAALRVLTNPADARLTLRNPRDTDERIELVNAVGTTVQRGIAAAQSDTHLEVGELRAGVYYVRSASSGKVIPVVIHH